VGADGAISGTAPIPFSAGRRYAALNGSRSMHIRIFTSIAISIAVLLGGTVDIHDIRASQIPAASSQEAAGTITGRVTIDNQGAPGVTVALQRTSSNRPLSDPVARATTDREGRFKMANLPAGSYYLVPLAPAHFASSEDRLITTGKPVTLMKGENLEGIELALTPGGAITGRVTTAGGWPVIGQETNAYLIETLGPRRMSYAAPGASFKTDDRGIYRIYGLPTGRYIVSVMSLGRAQQKLIYHPDTAEESQARPIEVTAGRVTEKVDIKLPQMTQTYELSGRIVDEATGQPIPKIPVEWGKWESIGKYAGSLGRMQVNERGEFLFTGLPPGRYAAFVPINSRSEYYSDRVAFEVTDQDVAGLEIKARSAASLSGTVVIEGVSDPAALLTPSHLSFMVFGRSARYGFGVGVGSDGRFRIPGLPPDKFRFSLGSNSRPGRFHLLGVERNGVRQQDGIEVAGGEQVTGLRLIVAYGTGVVNGQVQVVNGTLPQGTSMSVIVRRTDIPGHPDSIQSATVDARGRFLLEGLATGVYQINLLVSVPSHSGKDAPGRSLGEIKQTFTASSGAESQVTFVLDASIAKEEKR
jgi:5-hydroxyisourate hydrolase-like protein (transthyretin family)